MCSNLVSWEKKTCLLHCWWWQCNSDQQSPAWVRLTVRGLIFKANLNWHIIPGTILFFFNKQLCLLVSLSPPVWTRQVAGGSTVTVSESTGNWRLWWLHCLLAHTVTAFFPVLVIVAVLLTPATYPLCLSPTDFSVSSFFCHLLWKWLICEPKEL